MTLQVSDSTILIDLRTKRDAMVSESRRLPLFHMVKTQASCRNTLPLSGKDSRAWHRLVKRRHIASLLMLVLKLGRGAPDDKPGRVPFLLF